MSSLVISLLAFGCIFGGMVIGMFLRGILPEHHLSDESKGVVRLGTGMIATLAALVIGLLIASAKGNFDTMNSGLIHTGSKIVLLDRVMAQYGPETKEARYLLRRGIASVIERIWPKDRIEQREIKPLDPKAGIEALQEKLLQLSPRNDAQRWAQSRALQVSAEIAETRWLLFEQVGQSSLSMPFVVILVFWLVLIFFSFGLSSPRNPTVIVVLLICALSAAGSLFLIQELDQPYGGLITISSTPLRNALAYLGQ
ncbi:MAG: bestrophin-like domain [Syntrophales bacterium]